MSDLMTPTARKLLADLRREAESWNETATSDDDMNTFLRNSARARRDQLDAVVQRLTVDLPAIEDEAISVELSETARIERELDRVA